MHYPSVGRVEPLPGLSEFREHYRNLQQCAGLHAQPVGGSVMVGIMAHKEQRMVPYSKKEACKVINCPHRRTPEDLENRKPCRINPDSGLYGSPCCPRKRLFWHEGRVFDEFVCRPGFTERVHLGKELLGVFLILRDGIGSCKTLPINGAEKRPAPLIVSAGFRGWVEHPVNRTIELMSEDVMLHDLLGIGDNAVILYFRCLRGLKQVDGFLPLCEVLQESLSVQFFEIVLEMRLQNLKFSHVRFPFFHTVY